MRQRINIANDATRMARVAASDLANLRSAMRAAQDTLTGLTRAIKAPNTTPRRHTIKKQTTTSPLLEDANLALGVAGSIGSFYQSGGQSAGGYANAVQLAQRIL